MILKKIMHYITFKKDNLEETEGKNFNLRMMHRINKISILIFLFGILYLVVKFVVLK